MRKGQKHRDICGCLRDRKKEVKKPREEDNVEEKERNLEKLLIPTLTGTTIKF